MKFKLNPITGEFDIVDGNSPKQHMNPVTGEFNLVDGDGPYGYIFNPLSGKLNLIVKAATEQIVGIMELDITNAKLNGLKELKAYGGFAQAAGATTTNPQSIKCNNGVIKAKDNELPVGYKRLIDVIFDGDCHYETNVYLTGADTIRFTINASEAGRNVLGCYTGSGDGDNFSFYLATVSAGSYVRYKDSLYRPKYNSNKLGVDVSLEITPTGTIGFDTNVSWTQQTFTCSNNLYIGWLPNATSPKFLGSFKGEIVVDNRTKFIPCERVSDNAIGYYDTYNNVFYENQGTGTVTTSGYDYSHLTDIYVDGTTEKIGLSYLSLDGQGTFVSPSPSSTNRGYKAFEEGLEHINLSISSGWEFIVQGKTGNTGGNISGWVTSFDGNLSGYTTYGIAARKLNDVAFNYQNFDGVITINDNFVYATDLFKLGDIEDEHEILSGTITRKIGIVVLTGDENWSFASGTGYKQVHCDIIINEALPNVSLVSNVAPYGCTAGTRSSYNFGCYTGTTSGRLCFQVKGDTTINSANDWVTYLKNAYENGLPVYVIYPLVSPTTELIGAQEINIGAGSNKIEIIEAELDDLKLSAKYLSNN